MVFRARKYMCTKKVAVITIVITYNIISSYTCTFLALKTMGRARYSIYL